MQAKRWFVILILTLTGAVLILASPVLNHQSLAAAREPRPVITPANVLGKASYPSAVANSPNISFESSSPLAAPDLIVESITFHPDNPEVGESVDITVTVKNQGNEPASNFYVHLFVDPAEEPPTLTTTYTSRFYWGLRLDPGVSFQWTHTDELFTINGRHPVYAWVDRDDTISESDETNNLAGPVDIPVGTIVGDIYEEDDLCTQATFIPVDGTVQHHNLEPAPDKDWVYFEATGGVTYQVQAIADGVDADLVAELYGTCSGPPSFGTGTEFEFTAPADGTYFVKVEHVSTAYGPDTAYRLRVTQLDSCTGYYEPNDSCSVAGDIAIDAAPQLHNFCRSGDDDWGHFHTVAGASYVITVNDIGASANSRISLYTQCGNEPIQSGEQNLAYMAPVNGLLYVKVENHPQNTHGPATEYSLQVVQTGGCVYDSYEDDDTVSMAGTLTVGQEAQLHNFCPAGDVDWVKFNAVANTTYALETLNLGDEADTVLCIYDSSGAIQIACDDDSGSGYGSRISWQAPVSDLYTLRVKNDSTSLAPQPAGLSTSYDLRVIVGDCIADNWESDDTQGTAHNIPADGTKHMHNTCPAGDEDWVGFVANAGSYVIETTDLGIEADTYLELFDEAGNRLAFNDDYGQGTASRIHVTFDNGGTYYVRVRHYNPAQYGTGTEYALRIFPGSPPTVTPTATPTLPPTVTPTPTPPPSQVRTIILINQERAEDLYGHPLAAQLMESLDLLAEHDDVDGEIIRLDLNNTVSIAYAAWKLDPTSIEKANQVAAAIRGIILSYLEQHGGVEFIVLVGDDKLLPFRRILDNSSHDGFSEDDYPYVDGDHPSGAALQANFFLSDDYYADRNPTPFSGRLLYIPDLAIGRLIEGPNEIIPFINAFLQNSQVTVGTGGNKVLVTGYDFVKDTASVICDDWNTDCGSNCVDCTLIGDSWSVNAYRERQLEANPPFKVQSINGHANHYREGAPLNGQFIDANEIAAAPSDLSRGLIYTLGCHSGLNVPPENAIGSLDLAQVFALKQANYVANSGYGWGQLGTIGLSEKLMSLYSDELVRNTSVSLGQAFTSAKNRYYQEEMGFTGYDEKILEEAIFYGLPMYKLNTGGALGGDDPFPSVDIALSLPGSFGDEAVISGTLALQLAGALSPSDVMSQTVTDDGAFYTLDGHAHSMPDQPVHPLVYADVANSWGNPRSIVFRAGTYETLTTFDPLIALPVNEYVTQTTEATLETFGWWPALPIDLQSDPDKTHLVVQMGQYDIGNQQERLYGEVMLDLYYSLSTDTVPPDVPVVDSLYNPISGQIDAKVEAIDASGVWRVYVTYTQGNGIWNTNELSFDPSMHKWRSRFSGNMNTRYFVQVLDKAGNVTQVTNKGLYFSPAVIPLGPMPRSVFLPLTILE